MDGDNAKASRGRRISPLFTWRTAIVRSDLRSTAKHVALTLSLFMSEEGDSCFPAQSTLAQRCSLSRSAVIDAVKTLAVEGWLISQATRGRGRANLYTATVPEENVAENDTPQNVVLTPKMSPSTSENVAQDVTTTSKTTSEDHDRPRASARKRNPMFDELAVECGLRLDSMTKEAARLCGIAASEIAKAGGSPDMVRRAVFNYRAKFVGAAATPKAIANHWPEIVPATSRVERELLVCDECGIGGGHHLDDCSKAVRPTTDLG